MKLHSLSVAALLAASCADPGVTVERDLRASNLDRQAVLRNLAENVIVPTYQSFDSEVDQLVSAVQGYCAAIGGSGEPAARTSARDAWRNAMATWQEAEAFQIGPVAMNEGFLRARIYSWPVLSSCAVDQEVMRRHNNPVGYSLAGRLPNRRGLGALEYVLFSENLAATCPPQATPPGWNELDNLTRRQARCGFAGVAAADLATQAQTLLDAWLPGHGDYTSVLANAGASGNPFPSAQAALNVVSDALFYVDTEVKDMKLAKPAGIATNSCGTVGSACAADLESRFASHGKQNILANLRGVQAILLGGQGVGFDDLLVASQAPELASKFAADVAGAIALVEAIPGTLEQAVFSAPESVKAAHAGVKKVTDTLKTDFLTVLGLEIPDDAAADND